jgi:uncharacterized protein (TIGR02300 family)
VDVACATRFSDRFWSDAVAKSNWGLKRTCQSCATRFYDLGKDHIACPKCGAEFDPEAILKTKRGKPAAKAVPVPAKVVEAEVEADDLVIEEDVEGDEKDDEVIEDTSELGEDTEDVAEVIENVEEEER